MNSVIFCFENSPVNIFATYTYVVEGCRQMGPSISPSIGNEHFKLLGISNKSW